MKKIYLVFLLLFFLLITSSIVLYRKQTTFLPSVQTQPVTPQPPSETEKREEKIKEIQTEEGKKALFQEMFDWEVPEVYEKRIKAFSIPREEVGGVIKNLLIYPFPIAPVETLNIAVWTESQPPLLVDKVEGTIYWENNSEIIEFLLTKSEKRGEINRKIWLGIKNFEFPSATVGTFPLIIKAFDQSNQIIEEVGTLLEINY